MNARMQPRDYSVAPRQPHDLSVAPRQRAAFVALLAIVAWAPIPLGSNRGWSAGLLAAALLTLASLLLLARLWRSAPPRDWPAAASWPTALLAGWALFMIAQLVPLPLPLLELVSPTAAAAWQRAGAESAGSVSLDRGATLSAIVQAASLAALFVVVSLTASSWRRVQILCTVVVAMGAFEAALGVATELARHQGWVAAGPVEGVGGARGTFVNPNHYAGFLEVALCLSLGLSLSRAGEGEWLPGSARELASRAVAFSLSARAPLLAAQVLMVVALLWSGSRGAVAAVAVALPLVLAGALPPQRHAARGARLKGLAAGAAVVLVTVLWSGAGSLADKIAHAGVHGNRLPLAAATLDMAADFPLFGSGAGSYASVFPAYKTPALGSAFYEHAHNDYLQVLAEGGIVGAGLFLAAVGSAFVPALRRGRRRRSRGARAFTAGSLAACTCLLIHGLYDFNLQIPANAMLFVLSLALAVAASRLPRGD